MADVRNVVLLYRRSEGLKFEGYWNNSNNKEVLFKKGGELFVKRKVKDTSDESIRTV
ncbi:predicted protein [Sclerotinia sclerotiorum 1980 UF-70]|uniref:Uncharacterized protein n=1 Tax=Sclerotinia sclerotiorum (strain ATCC 18683 / 1980 / Ss-1) TaxID=665079 RepID=A7F7Y5_SCLS1|nr:predicted protein [Sclerotinia sclerotiorum 1980 UF-70]EDN98856.1 predicted protein [Sclerotinia sclerotiorum 1980 UF-70]